MQESRDCVHNTARDIEASGRSIDEVFSGIGKTVTAAFSITTAAAFVKKIYEVRSYFQDIESSMVVFLGSQEKAAKFTKNLKDYAWYNMFEFSDLADASKQLIAYGNDVDKISGKGGILDQLSNIATATKQPLMDLVNLWNKAKGTGKVDANAMESWANKGLVLRDVLQEIGETVNGNTVSFEQLQMAIQHVTDEGGMFAGIMDQMMPNLSSSWGQLQDDLDSMFNEIGESMQGAFKGGIEFASTLVANYKDVIDVISTLVGIYGTYRVALFTLNTLEKAHAAYIALEETAHIQNALATEADIAVKGKATVATVLFQKAQAALNATLLSNPYVLVAAAIAALVGSMIYLATNVKSTQEVIDDLNDSVSDMKDMKEETSEVASLADEYDNLKSKAELSADESARLLQITQQLAGYLPTAISNFDEYGNAIDINTEAVREEIEQRNQDLKAIMQGRLNEAMSRRQEVEEQMQRNRDILSTGMVTWRANGQDVSAEATAEEKQKAMERLEQLRGEYSTLNSTIREANKVVTGYYDNLNAFTGALSDKNIEQLQQIKTALEEQIKSGDKGVLTVGDFFTYDFSGKSDEFISEALSEISKKLPQKGTETQDKTGDKITDEKNKLKELIRDAGRDMQDAQDDMQSKITDATIAAMDEGEAKVKAARAKANQDELDDIETQRENAIRKYIESQKKIFDQKEKIKKTQDSKYKVQYFDESTVDLTEINKMYDELANLTARRQLKDITREELESMRDYLKEYGTLQERRLALQKEYDEKIASSRNEWERRSLEKERDEAIESMRLTALEAEIDWTTMFDHIGAAFRDEIEVSIDKLNQFIKSDEFKKLDATNKRQYIDMRNTLQEKIGPGVGTFDFSIYNRIGENLQSYQDAIKQSEMAHMEHEQAIKDLQQAEKELEEATSDDEKARKQVAVYHATQAVQTTGEQQRQADSNLVDTQDNLRNSTEQAQSALDNFSDALDTMSNGTLKGFADGIVNLIAALKGTKGEGLSGLGKAGGIIGAILAIIDAVGDDFVGFVDDLFDGIINAIVSIIDSLIVSITDVDKGWLSSFAQSLLKNVFKLIAAVIQETILNVTARAFGLGDLLDFSGDSDETLEEDIEQLTASNEALKYSIDSLSEKMMQGAVVDAEKLYKEQKAMLEQSISNVQSMMNRSAGAYSNGYLGIGGEHSSGYFVNEGISEDEWNRVSAVIGRTIDSAGAFIGLTSEEMHKVAEQLPDIYGHIKDLANDGYKDAAQYMDEYIEYWKQLQQLEGQYFEKLTSTTFDSVEDQFTSTLMNMDSEAEDFADDFEKMMQKAMVNSFASEQIKPLLQKWYKAFASYMGPDGKIDEAEMQKLRESGGTYYDYETGRNEEFQSWNDLVQMGMNWRDSMMEAFGWSGGSEEQKVTSKGYQAMSQELGASLEGRFTTLVITGENIAAQMIVVTGQISDMRVICESSNGYLEEIRNMFILANGYLEDIYKYSKQIYTDFSDKLNEIATNTK